MSLYKDLNVILSDGFLQGPQGHFSDEFMQGPHGHFSDECIQGPLGRTIADNDLIQLNFCNLQGPQGHFYR